MRPGELIGVAARTSIGKCLALGTRVIQANGSDIAVERLKVGDSLLGPDGKPRRVVAVHEGNDDLYRVDQVCGDSYVVNSRTCDVNQLRSEEHTSELQSLMRISYAVFCLKKNMTPHTDIHN